MSGYMCACGRSSSCLCELHVPVAAEPAPPTDGVTPAEIARQRELGWPDFHPEDFCHRCGRPNPCWFADTAEWQTATGSTGDGGGILCPSCFCAQWESATGRTAIVWRLSIDPRSRDAEPAPPTDGLREEIADALAAQGLVHVRQYTDAVLALPGIQRLIAAEEAVRRVRELLALYPSGESVTVFRLRRALDDG